MTAAIMRRPWWRIVQAVFALLPMRSTDPIRAPRRGRGGAAEGRTLTLSTSLAGLPYRVRRQGLGGVGAPILNRAVCRGPMFPLELTEIYAFPPRCPRARRGSRARLVV